ncbi:MAG: glycosyltransferase family 4 protein [Candidatus Magasanikbacteria bacterium]|jgi:glycosyltransferase involved in cell wall biosynthesis|nr:glycosyltransferase family 4 protein [Candidatus Magasanikbacteria bacterium]MBT4314840.1 glycosyltransferase family 4 protein [Candidatus Magasanikbacteria bacterium]MBT4547617.1 glycosyltransferase family 4 protein [Candidatus Magasanikbacteria bacterium]MBT6819247.1 glycosyltransferase family 4 protein [Candidatus Magasanikbacteria bacterium]
MKIAIIGQKGIPATQGGVERHVHELSVRLVKFGHKVTVYARKWYTGSDEDYKTEGVEVKHLPSVHTKHLDAITHSIVATLHAIKHNYDIIHYHGVGPSLVSWIPRLLSRKTKVIVTFHSIDRYHSKWNIIAKTMLRLGEWTACNFPHETITISQSLQKYCINEFTTDTHCIPNAFDPKPAPTSSNELDKFGLEKDNYIVMVSRLVPHKGAHLLINAFNKLKLERGDDERIKNLKLAIVGGSAYTDKYVKQLHEMASINNQIIFTDFQSGDALEQLYAHAKLLVHPSDNEGLPFTVLEAMSYSKPVLVSNIPEHLELIDDPRAIFTTRNTRNLEKKLYSILSLPEENLQGLGQRNKNTIERHYTWGKLMPKIVEVYGEQADEPELVASEGVA